MMSFGDVRIFGAISVVLEPLWMSETSRGSMLAPKLTRDWKVSKGMWHLGCNWYGGRLFTR